MSPKHEAFAIEIDLRTPISFKALPPTLDGVCASILYSIDPASAPERLAAMLANRAGVFVASCAILEAPDGQRYPSGAGFAKTTSQHSLTDLARTPWKIAPGGPGVARGRKYPHLRNDNYKSLLERRSSYAAPRLWFAGEGDAAAIAEILSLAPGIGGRTGEGFGAIEPGGIRIHPARYAARSRTGWADTAGCCLRPVPLDSWRAFARSQRLESLAGFRRLSGDSVARAPYWDIDRRELCALPDQLSLMDERARIRIRLGVDPGPGPSANGSDSGAEKESSAVAGKKLPSSGQGTCASARVLEPSEGIRRPLSRQGTCASARVLERRIARSKFPRRGTRASARVLEHVAAVRTSIRGRGTCASARVLESIIHRTIRSDRSGNLCFGTGVQIVQAFESEQPQQGTCAPARVLEHAGQCGVGGSRQGTRATARVLQSLNSLRCISVWLGTCASARVLEPSDTSGLSPSWQGTCASARVLESLRADRISRSRQGTCASARVLEFFKTMRCWFLRVETRAFARVLQSLNGLRCISVWRETCASARVLEQKARKRLNDARQGTRAFARVLELRGLRLRDLRWRGTRASARVLELTDEFVGAIGGRGTRASARVLELHKDDCQPWVWRGTRASTRVITTSIAARRGQGPPRSRRDARSGEWIIPDDPPASGS
ncbi:MAG: hypothetical protein IBJ15_00355 [Alphaproteobacteria bacterium]|nr:hypothetical protein [Alphaproteobacteria bacterium]